MWSYFYCYTFLCVLFPLPFPPLLNYCARPLLRRDDSILGGARWLTQVTPVLTQELETGNSWHQSWYLDRETGNSWHQSWYSDRVTKKSDNRAGIQRGKREKNWWQTWRSDRETGKCWHQIRNLQGNVKVLTPDKVFTGKRERTDTR